MIYDARTNPLGLKVSAEQWPKQPLVRQISRQRGFKVPAPNFVAAEARPVRAFVNHGVWKAWCVDCVGRAEDVWRDRLVFFCMWCGNASAGGSWRPVLMPDNWQEIEARLDPFPQMAQNWEPWGGADPFAEAEAWAEQAAVMTDPDQGLRAEVADDA